MLDNHAPIVAALGKGQLKILKDKNSSEIYNIEGGFVEMNSNKIGTLHFNLISVGICCFSEAITYSLLLLKGLACFTRIGIKIP